MDLLLHLFFYPWASLLRGSSQRLQHQRWEVGDQCPPPCQQFSEERADCSSHPRWISQGTVLIPETSTRPPHPLPWPCHESVHHSGPLVPRPPRVIGRTCFSRALPGPNSGGIIPSPRTAPARKSRFSHACPSPRPGSLSSGLKLILPAVLAPLTPTSA